MIDSVSEDDSIGDVDLADGYLHDNWISFLLVPEVGTMEEIDENEFALKVPMNDFCAYSSDFKFEKNVDISGLLKTSFS